MSFRQTGQRDPRRRRVLADLVLGQGSGAKRSAGASSRLLAAPRSKHYGEAAFLEDQLRLTDLVPRRIGVLALLFVLGLLMGAGLVGLHAWIPRLASMTSDGTVEAFDLDGEGTLAVWFSSTVLFLASFTSVVVYTVRRHKKDDYQGRYRIWLWGALCWLLLSMDETASLHEGFMGMMTALTGTPLLGDGSAWWMIAYFFLLGGIGTRLALDMRECRLSLAAFLSAGLCYVLAVVAQLGWIWETQTAREIMLEEGAEMTGNVLLLLAMSLHARHVILDAQGLLPQSAPEEDAEAADDAATSEDDHQDECDQQEAAAEQTILFGQPIRVQSAPATRRFAPAPATSKPPLAGGLGSSSAGMRAAENQVKRKLTKQEKKALRHRLEKMRIERERRSA